MSKRLFLIGLVAVLVLVGTVSASTYLMNATVGGYMATTGSTNKTFADDIAGSASGSGTDRIWSGVTAKANPPNYFGTMAKNKLVFNFTNFTTANPGAVISGAVLYTDTWSACTDTGLGGTRQYALISNTRTNENAIATADYASAGYGTTLLSDSLPQPADTSGLWRNFTLNAAGLSYISSPPANGILGLSMTMTDVPAGTFSGTWIASEVAAYCFYPPTHATVSVRPYMVITFSTPDTTPPGAIQGLTNDTTACQQITWDWQGPADADWNGTMIYRDGAFLYNVSNTTYQDVWSGLTGGQTYEFASHTFDITGNVDPDWINQSATVTACGDTTPPASITNLTNSTATCEQIIFDWDNPTDPDFNGTEYWLNDVKGTNFTASDGSWILFGGLTGGVEYTFSTRTFDTSGNANATFVNMTATPEPCGIGPDFTANVTCQIGAPLAVNFTGNCPDPDYKNHWDFGDGNTTDDIQSPEHIYTFIGAFTVVHSCKFGGQPTVFENKTDYIIVGVNGTVCEGNCSSAVTSGSGSCSAGRHPDDIMWLIYGLVGGIVGVVLLSKR